MKPEVFAKIILWSALVITGMGCGYFIYDNIVLLINFSTWVPDREINLKASIGMLTASIITLFNLVWLVLLVVTDRPPDRLMKLVLAVSGALSLIFALSLTALILFRLNLGPPDLSTFLTILYVIALAFIIARLFRLIFRSNQ